MNSPQVNWNVLVGHWPGYFIRERLTASSYRAEISRVNDQCPGIIAEVVLEGEYRFYLTHSSTPEATKTQIGRSYRTVGMASRRARTWVHQNFKKKGPPRPWLRIAGTLVAALFVYSLIMPSNPRITVADQDMSRLNSTVSIQQPLGAATASLTRSDFRADSEVRLYADELLAVQTIGKALGIQLGSSQSEASWFVFADPLCPYCHAMQPAIDALPEYQRPVVIPVGLRSDLSVEVVASLFEAVDRKEQPAIELWRSFMDQSFDEEKARYFISRYPASPANKKKGFVTQALFSKLGLKKTPTVVSPDGRLTGPSNSADDLRDWLRLPKED
ncbi:thioredoxin fold domain-containing protein (plasmid) [Achromobacter denitrificans]